MPRYLEKRRRRWYAYLEIPKDVRQHNSSARLIKSLGTESLSEAERLVLPQVAMWKTEFEQLRAGKDKPLEAEAREWRDDLANASDETREIYDSILDDKLREIQAQSPEKVETVSKIVRGETEELTANLDVWVGTLQNAAKTIDMKRSDVERFADEFPYTHLVTKRAVQRWAHKLQHEQGLKLATIRRIVSACQGYWRYLDRAGYIDRDDAPFTDVLDRGNNRTKTGKEEKRAAISADDVVALMHAAERKKDVNLSNLVRLAMWTGCRIEELCSLEVGDVLSDRIVIDASKTKAGERSVPVHSKLKPLIDDLCRNSKDGYVISRLSFNKYGDRSNAIGKRFGRLKKEYGFGAAYVFHSIRKTVATRLENAGIAESISADILGHEKQTMTYGLYSGGTEFSLMKQAIEKLSYPV
jgi:integrase